MDLADIAANQETLEHKSFNDAFGLPGQLRMSVGRLAPGGSVEHHRHFTMEEVYYLMKGRAMVRVDDDEYEVEENTAIYFPPEPMRSVYNHTDEDCWWLFVGGASRREAAGPEITTLRPGGPRSDSNVEES